MKIFISVASASKSEARRNAKAEVHEVRKNILREEIKDCEELIEDYSNDLVILEKVQAARKEIGYDNLKKTGKALITKLKLPPKSMAVYSTEAALKREIALNLRLIAKAEADAKKAANKLAKLEAKG